MPPRFCIRVCNAVIVGALITREHCLQKKNENPSDVRQRKACQCLYHLIRLMIYFVGGAKKLYVNIYSGVELYIRP